MHNDGKASTVTKAPKSATKVVRHSAKSAAASAATSAPALDIGIDRQALLKKLVKLTNSKEEAVALDATKTLLTMVK